MQALANPLRAHVRGADSSHGDRLFHGVAAERLAQFLVDQRLDQRVVLPCSIWSVIAWFSAAVSCSMVRA